MDDLDRVTVDDSVENLVTVAMNDLDPNPRVTGPRRAKRMLTDEIDAGVDSADDVGSATWASQFKIPENLIDIRKGLQTISNPHARP
jgi:hypothetical protein